MRQRSPSKTTLRDANVPRSRSMVSVNRGMAIVSMSWRTVWTDCSLRFAIVGGPSGADGGKKGEPGRETEAGVGGPDGVMGIPGVGGPDDAGGCVAGDSPGRADGRCGGSGGRRGFDKRA